MSRKLVRQNSGSQKSRHAGGALCLASVGPPADTPASTAQGGHASACPQRGLTPVTLSKISSQGPHGQMPACLEGLE